MANTHFHIHAMKEPDYVMSLMSSYDTNQRMGKETHCEWRSGGSTQQTTFPYPEVICNHFLYRHAVDDHNGKRHSPISLEVVWGTKWCPNRVFAFLLTVTEVYVNLGMTYLLGQEVTGQIAFRIKLAHTLIHNRHYNDEEDMSPVIRSKRQQRVPGHATHELLTLAKRKKFDGGRIVESESSYPQHKCNGCSKKIHTNCKCTPGVYRCRECYGVHLIQNENQISTPPATNRRSQN